MNHEEVEDQVIKRIRRFRGQNQIRKAAINVLVKMESNSNVTISHLRDQFEAIDSDKTGMIDAKKLMQVMDANYTEEEVNKIIDEIDMSGSHMINYTEFVAATIRAKDFIGGEKGEAKLNQIFRQFDADNSGSVNLLDVKLAMEKIGKSVDENEVKRSISKYGKNSDGELDRKEFESMFLADLSPLEAKPSILETNSPL